MRLRRDQCCAIDGCMRPARYGDLCAVCFMAASPARRAAELLTTTQTDPLELLWALPARSHPPVT